MRGQGPLVGRVNIKVGRPDQQIFRIGRFQYEQAARHKDANGLGKQGLECVERQMLCNMKARHCQQAAAGQRDKMRQGIHRHHIQAALKAGSKHAIVGIHTAGRNTMVAQ